MRKDKRSTANGEKRLVARINGEKQILRPVGDAD